MSSNLRAEPIKRKKKDFGSDLKFALRKRFGEPVDVLMEKGDIEYLLGLEHAGITEAKELRDYIMQHEEIRIKEEY